MPRKPSFSFTETIFGWKVEMPAALAMPGKREREFLPTQDKARAFWNLASARGRCLKEAADSLQPPGADADKDAAR